MNPTKIRLFLTIAQLFAVILLVIGVTLAWFAVSTETNASLFGQVGGVNVEAILYVYEEPNYLGANNQMVTTHSCSSTEDDHCYRIIPNPTAFQLGNENRELMPGDRFSFAVRIINLGQKNEVMNLVVSNVLSSGYLLDQNQIQRAISYRVTKITTMDSSEESMDIKDTLNISYAGKNLSTSLFFTLSQGPNYSLVSGIGLMGEGIMSEIIIYFDLYFDPEVEGFDANGSPVGNSNPFMSQTFMINEMLISFD